MKWKLNSLYLCVENMERALAFYERFLGQKAETEDDVFSVFNIRGFRYCLFQPDRVGETVRRGDSCLPSFETKDIGEALELVRALDRPIVFPLKQIGKNRVFEFTDTEGNDIEVYSPVKKEEKEEIRETEHCPCKRVKCERHGKCAECMEHHRTKKHPPACKRSKAKKEKKAK